MRKFYYCAAVVLLAITFSSCNNAKKADATATADSIEVTDMHNAENALDFYGEYKGTIPAADCPGIDVTLTLHKDKTFTSRMVFLERDSSFENTGIFTIDGNILTLTAKEGGISYYKVEEGRILMLNADKQPAEGEMKDKYVLKQEKTF